MDLFGESNQIPGCKHRIFVHADGIPEVQRHAIVRFIHRTDKFPNTISPVHQRAVIFDRHRHAVLSRIVCQRLGRRHRLFKKLIIGLDSHIVLAYHYTHKINTDQGNAKAMRQINLILQMFHETLVVVTLDSGDIRAAAVSAHGNLIFLSVFDQLPLHVRIKSHNLEGAGKSLVQRYREVSDFRCLSSMVMHEGKRLFHRHLPLPKRIPETVDTETCTHSLISFLHY